jgi:hypothetical protein
LSDFEIRRVLKFVFHVAAIEIHIRLGARGPNGWAFFAIKDAVLDTGFIDGFAHLATERIDFFDQVSFGGAANSWVTAHGADAFDVLGDEKCLGSRACRAQRSLAAGVTAANHNDVKAFK